MKTLPSFVALAALALACGAPVETPARDGGAPPDAGSVAPPLVLAPGEVAEFSMAEGIAGGRLATPTGNERFTIVLASTRFDDSGAAYAYGVTQGVDLSGGAAAGALVTGCSLSTRPWSSTPPPLEVAPTGATPDAGATRTLIMQTATRTEVITVQAIATSASAIIWADTTPAHPAALDAGFVEQFLADFEQTILPRERALFGVESDVDGDGHIGLVFTPLTFQTAVAFFTPCDLKNVAGCPAGNAGEYLYLTPPNAILPPYNTPNAIKEILSHECSHLIHFNRKVLRNGLASWPDSSYLDEGVGAFAQDAVGPQAGNLYVTKAGLDGIDDFSLSRLFVDQAPYDTSRDGVLRGGSYLFVRYLYDRAGGDRLGAGNAIVGLGGPSFLRAVLDAPGSVTSQLSKVTGSPPADIAIDFYSALALSNREQGGGVAPANPCFAYLPTSTDPAWSRQRGANLYAAFSSKMTGPATQPASSADGSLLGGGVEYLTLGASSGPELPFTVQVAPGAQARMRVARVQ